MIRAQPQPKKYAHVSKSEALRALRIMFGPTTRIAGVKRHGVAGVRIFASGSIMHTTFDLSGDVWLRVVEACHPYWKHTEARAQ